MKIDLSTIIKTPKGTPIEDEGEPVTLRQGIYQALTADPLYESGHAQGTPRPLSAAEITESEKVCRMVSGSDIVDLSTDDVGMIRKVVQRLRVTWSLPICIALEAGVADS